MSLAPVANYTANEMMTIAAARLLRDEDVCFVGIGMPSAAANLARATVAPNIVLIYESGTIGAKPSVLPLSIGDGELALTADTVVSVPEIFSYWLQAGRVDVGFLGAAQIDKFANINTTVIGDYARPKVRLPGAGGAPEIAAAAKEVYIIIEQSTRTFVQACDFITSAGYLDGFDARSTSGARGAGPTVVITDLGILRPDPVSKELTLVGLHPGVSIERARASTGWELRVSPALTTTPAPTRQELTTLRDLHARTAAAHANGRAASA
jgi:glutaconate CoA-transferase subunit B